MGYVKKIQKNGDLTAIQVYMNGDLCYYRGEKINLCMNKPVLKKYTIKYMS